MDQSPGEPCRQYQQTTSSSTTLLDTAVLHPRQAVLPSPGAGVSDLCDTNLCHGSYEHCTVPAKPTIHQWKRFCAPQRVINQIT